MNQDRHLLREAAASIGHDNPPCANCWHPKRKVVAKNLCKPCHEYQRRTGRPRPIHLLERFQNA